MTTVKGTAHGKRVFLVQRAFADLDGDCHGPAAIAKATGLDRATVYRVLQDGLADGNFVQVKENGRQLYRLGPGAFRLSMQALAQTPDEEMTHAVLDKLQRSTGGLVAYYAVVGTRRICTDYAIGDFDPKSIGIDPFELVKYSRSLRTGASGRVILAHMPAPFQEKVLAEQVPEGVGPGVIRDNDVLVESLKDIIDSGFAIGRQECMSGWDSVAVPVMWDETIQGSLLLWIPAQEMPEDTSALVAATLMAGDMLSRIASAPGNASAA
ncbi:IclR family transcriptional regulator [Streptomyces sp. AP-93]|uniref:IclR family transcriptional regulator n=1 Tax=Streptomyces sp. AP-93 TaxID=2929048 RepID=UPI001FAEF239|nr:IclR family transcriptional regulator C-terminal domain-containing protein [Streptomyces sp. AP-93]MCJ0870246.1 IclR family transcriptional regulator [Streptomyces sp. AP-93]